MMRRALRVQSEEAGSEVTEAQPGRRDGGWVLPIGLVITIVGAAVGYGELRARQANDHEAITQMQPAVQQTREDVAVIKAIVQAYRPDPRVALTK